MKDENQDNNERSSEESPAPSLRPTCNRLGWVGRVIIVLALLAIYKISLTAEKIKNVVQEEEGESSMAKQNVSKGSPSATTNSTKAPLGSSSDAADSSFDWDAMADRLCPNMVPNVALGEKLFQLARQELPGNNATCPSNTDEMSRQFYQTFWGVKSYITNSQKRIAFVPIWKCANDELRAYLERNFESDNFFALTQTQRESMACLVTVIRDPVSHFLSAYNEVDFRLDKGRSDRSSVASTWNFYHAPKGTKQRFEQFLIDFLSCPFERGFRGIYKDLWGGYPHTLEIGHTYSMSSVLHYFAVETRVNVTSNLTYLPTLTNLSHTFGPFLVHNCPEGTFSNQSESWLRHETVYTNHHESSKDVSGSYHAAIDVWKQASSFSKALCAMHIMDYACWNGLPDGIPHVCMEVYKSYDEQGIL